MLTTSSCTGKMAPAGNKSARDWRPGIYKRIGRASGFFCAQRSALHYVGLDEAVAILAGSLYSCTPTSFSPGSMIGVMLSGNPRNIRITDMNTQAPGKIRLTIPTLFTKTRLAFDLPRPFKPRVVIYKTESGQIDIINRDHRHGVTPAQRAFMLDIIAQHGGLIVGGAV